jgi:serine-type D-Ala-D-Ala carboxypeptidase/endopeptidase
MARLRSNCVSTLTLLVMVCTFADAAPDAPALETRVDSIVAPLIENEELVGLVVAIVEDDKVFKKGYGHIDGSPSSPPPDGDTIFEIGSVTKTFTSLMLAQFVEQGRCKLEDPVAKYLPKDVGPVRTDGRDVRLVDLATHSSGLPRLPSNLQPRDPGNPYADYDETRLLDYLRQRSKLGIVEGVSQLLNPNLAMHSTSYGKFSYSNLGVGLLGHVLARMDKMTYEETLRKHVAEPLEMGDTWCSVDETRKPRLAPGHTDGDPILNWGLASLAGAGEIRSTAHDLIRYTRAQFDDSQTPLAAAIRLTHEQRIEVTPKVSVGLGWQILKESNWIMHDGQTGGYSSSVFCDPKGKKAIVVLSNQATSKVPLLGLALYQLLTGQKVKPIRSKPVVKVGPKTLREYEGTYQLTPAAKFTIRAADGKLRARLTGQAEARLFAESPDRFFYRIVDATIIFERDKDGRVDRLRLLQNGKDLPAKRVEDG